MNGKIAHRRQPFAFILAAVKVPDLFGKCHTDISQISTRIKAWRDVADIIAKRFAISQIGRARQHIDLRASIIGVVFARDIPTGKRQQLGHHIAQHRATCVRRVQWPGGIGRDILNIDRPPFADVIAAIAVTSRYDGCQFIRPQLRRDPDIDKAGASNLDIGNTVNCLQMAGKNCGKITRLHPGRLGQHHRRIAGKIAMRGIAWQFEDNTARIKCGRQFAIHSHLRGNGFKFSFKPIENIHFYLKIGPSSNRR